METMPVETQAPAIEETQAPAPRNMLKEEGIQKRINLFLSNFAEQNFRGYPAGEYKMLTFAYIYSKINSNGLITYSNGDACISKSDMDAVLMQYFGRSIEPFENASFGDGYGSFVYYRNGQYIFTPGDGEFYGYVAVVTSMTDNGDGTYSVQFNIYSVAEDVYFNNGSMSHYYGMSAAEAAADSTLTLYSSGQATVKDYTRANGVQSYHLVWYNV